LLQVLSGGVIEDVGNVSASAMGRPHEREKLSAGSSSKSSSAGTGLERGRSLFFSASAQSFGPQSTQHLSDLVSGKTVVLECENERSYGLIHVQGAPPKRRGLINRQFRFALRLAAKGGAPAEPILDRMLASLEHLKEIAEKMMRRLDELLTAV
jgi:hypothetical protein